MIEKCCMECLLSGKLEKSGESRRKDHREKEMHI